MRNQWYGDNRDLVKWSVLLHIADLYDAKRILQVAYLNPTEFPTIRINNEPHPIPAPIIRRFRNIRDAENIKGSMEIKVFDEPFEERESYHRKVLEWLDSYSEGRGVVILDPDTGLQPGVPNMKHVLDYEVGEIWNSLKPGDVFVFYQHQTNRAGKPWVPEKKEQLAKALGVSKEKVLIAEGFKIARDVVLLYSQRN